MLRRTAFVIVISASALLADDEPNRLDKKEARMACNIKRSTKEEIETARSKGRPVPDKRKPDICIELQGGSDSMEPMSIPAGIKVDNQSQVILRVIGISPLDNCSVTGISTRTEAASPISALLSTLSATPFGSFSLGTGGAVFERGTPAPTINSLPADTLTTSASPAATAGPSAVDRFNASAAIRTEETKRVAKQLKQLIRSIKKPETEKKTKIENDPVYEHFVTLVKRADADFSKEFDELTEEQTSLIEASKNLLKYLGDDYRDTRWTCFRPTKDLTKVKAHLGINSRLISALGTIQGELDSLTGLAKELHDKHDFGKEEDTANVNGSMSIMVDIDKRLETFKAETDIITAFKDSLTATQKALNDAYIEATQLEAEFAERKGASIKVYSAEDNSHSFLYRDYIFAKERRAVDTRTLTCVSYADSKTMTLGSNVSFPVLYQSVPLLSLSPGILMTFRQKYNLGVTTIAGNDDGSSSQQIFGVTDRSRLQVLPMSFLNLRLGSHDAHLPIPLGRESHAWFLMSGALTAGVGVNSNSGTNQVEFFVGPSLMLGKVVISPGVHYGRVQSLGGGFTLNSKLPSDWPDSASAPINWTYKPSFSIGFSFRSVPW